MTPTRENVARMATALIRQNAGDVADMLRALLVRAEAARLRRGWLATIQTENSCPATGGGCLAKRCGCLAKMEMLMREDDARTALATEARDE